MASTTFPSEEAFWQWTQQIPVASRDAGLGPISPWGTQRELVRQILAALKDGVHQVLVTKAGQVGCSMAMSLLTAYWVTHYDGLQGVIVANADDVRDYFRDNLVQMVGAVQAEPPRINNQAILAWPNGSRLMFNTAGVRSGAAVSVGRGFAFGWGTETALWQHPQALTILRTRFSDAHPQRLSVFESTPRGRNWWYDVWTEAEDAADIRRIELYWWMREDYALDPASEAYRKYWDGRLTARERRWEKEIRRRFHRTLTPRQLAWRRYYVAERAGGDERAADQEMATLVEEGFSATGSSFLAHESIARCRRSVRSAARPDRYRYEFGTHFEDTRVKRTIPGYGTLAVWRKPEPVQGYVVSAVPGFSATADCPEYVVSVWKASRDELEQVAEFGDEDCGLQPYSWVCQHLKGAYRIGRRAFILETVGLGQGVLQEIRRLESGGWGTLRRKQVDELVGPANNYMWRRPDSLTGSVALQWRSSPEMRGWVLNRLRDQLSAGTLIVRSPRLLEEIERLRQDGESFRAEGRQARDHRVMAAALAVESWASQLRPLFLRLQGGSKATSVIERTVETFFDQLRASPTSGVRR